MKTPNSVLKFIFSTGKAINFNSVHIPTQYNYITQNETTKPAFHATLIRLFVTSTI